LHLHAGHGGHADGSAASPLAWLNLGRVPLLILIMIMLGAFATAGVAAVLVLHLVGIAAPWVVTVPVAIIVSVQITRRATLLLARLLPRDETYVTSPDDFLGRTAQITLGPARSGVVATAKVKDRFGNWHFPHVEPLRSDAEIAQGTTVLIVDRRGDVLLVAPAEGLLAGSKPVSS
jgi:hypothetical protein